MTDPADSDQLRNAVCLQGATIGRHEELLQNLMEGFHILEEQHDQGFNSLLEQFCRLSVKQQGTTENSQKLGNPTTSGAFPQTTLASRKPCLPPPELYVGILEPAGCFSPTAP